MLYASGYVRVKCRTNQHALSKNVSWGFLSHLWWGRRKGGLKIARLWVIVHEASATSDHDILDIWERLELGRTDENGGSLPDGEVLKEKIGRAHV